MSDHFSSPVHHQLKHRRPAARAAAVVGVVAFALSTVTLAATVEFVKPEWRDPEFGHRLRQLQKWKVEFPDRPLVLFLGTSRTQMGVSPAAMGFGCPCSPLVYNFGMIAGRHRRVHLNLIRLQSEGIVPAAVVIEAHPLLLFSPATLESELLPWASRLTARDLQLVAPYTSDLSEARRQWAGSRIASWSQYRLRLLTALAPEWVPAAQRENGRIDRMDEYGFAPHPIESLSSAQASAIRTRVREQWFTQRDQATAVSPEADRANRDLVEWCRAKGVAIAFFWVPESPAFRTFYHPGERAVAEEYARQMSAALGVTFFDAPEHFAENDFIDGHHLVRCGAEKYSRWLADTHLRPWLAE